MKAEEAIVMGERGSDVGAEEDSCSENDIPPRKNKVGVFCEHVFLGTFIRIYLYYV